MKDHYATLGVLPNAEDVVIKAAYRALAQRYHPDRYTGSAEEANRRMAEINEAYNVLSDPAKRREYDQSRATAEQDYSAFADNPEGAEDPAPFDELNVDWQLACEYFPDLKEINNRLITVAHRLAATYRLLLLETKSFNDRLQIADRMEHLFLERYFGTSPEIIAFARRLIQTGQKEALKALNNAVRVLGSNIPSLVIIGKITSDFAPKPQYSGDLWHTLRRAICDGDTITVSNLLRADPNLLRGTNSEGDTPLHLAVRENKAPVVEVLLAAGANSAVENCYGKRPIDQATPSGKSVMAEIFRRYKS